MMKRNKKTLSGVDKRNHIADDLHKPKYHQRVVQSKKNYNRKDDYDGRRVHGTYDDVSSGHTGWEDGTG